MLMGGLISMSFDIPGLTRRMRGAAHGSSRRRLPGRNSRYHYATGTFCSDERNKERRPVMQIPPALPGDSSHAQMAVWWALYGGVPAGDDQKWDNAVKIILDRIATKKMPETLDMIATDATDEEGE